MRHASFRIYLYILALASVLSMIGCGGGEIPRIAVTTTVSTTPNPLVANYSVTSLIPGTVLVEFGTDASYPFQTASYPVQANKTLSVLVAGMKPSTAYHMRAQISVDGRIAWTDEDRVFTTGAVSTPLPPLIVTRNSPSNPQYAENGGVEQIAFTSSYQTLNTFVTDRDGNLIWYYTDNSRALWFYRIMPNGHILTCLLPNTNKNLPSLIREIDLAGNTIREMDSTAISSKLHAAGHSQNVLNFHHDFLPLANGHIILLGQTTKHFTNLVGYPGTTTVYGDMLIDLDQGWNPVWVWSAFDHLDVNRHLQAFPDWTHSNAIVYNPSDGNLMLSIRHQSWIVGIDYQNGSGSGNLLWRLGDQGDFNLAGGDASQWFYAQHFPYLVSVNGPQITLAVFDNGNLRVLDSHGDTCGGLGPDCFTRATLFKFDQGTMQAQLVWQYAPGFFSDWGGATVGLPNGSVEFGMSQPFGTKLGSRVMEMTPSSPSEVVWQMDIRGGHSYRAYRIPSLYPGVSWP
jgi:arylsulfate sulfotransferase